MSAVNVRKPVMSWLIMVRIFWVYLSLGSFLHIYDNARSNASYVLYTASWTNFRSFGGQHCLSIIGLIGKKPGSNKITNA